MTPDEFATSRGHKLGKVDTAGRFKVRTCKRCGARLVVSAESPNGWGQAIEADCRRNDGDTAA